MCETTLSFIFYFTGFLLVITLINVWYLTTSKTQEYGRGSMNRNDNDINNTLVRNIRGTLNNVNYPGSTNYTTDLNAGGMFNYGETLATKEERQTMIDNISYNTLSTDRSM